jgi:hypothetical protein
MGIRLRRNYRTDLANQLDPLTDISELDLDWFWMRCEELLPTDWAFGLFAVPDPNRPGKLAYQARADLIDPDHHSPPQMITEYQTTPLRAIEKLYYSLKQL